MSIGIAQMGPTMNSAKKNANDRKIAAVFTLCVRIAGIISPWSFGYLIDRTGSWVVPFVASIVLLLFGAVMATRLRPDEPFVEFDVAILTGYSETKV